MTIISAMIIPSTLCRWKMKRRIVTMHTLFIILSSFCANLAKAGLDVDNGVLGTPEVECGRDFVHFKVATKKPFHGRVYVKGEFDNPKCVQSMVEAGGGGGLEEEGIDGNRRKSDGAPSGGAPDGHFDAPIILDKSGKKAKGGGQQKGGGGGEEKLVEGTEGGPSGGEGGRGKVGGSGGGGGGGAAVPEGEEEEEQHTERRINGADEGDEEEETIRQILQELQKRRNGNLDKAQRPIPSHFPGFADAEQLKRWRSFLGGRPGLDGQGFRRYGSKLSPDANGECPLVCPPCEDCAGRGKEGLKRKRRVADHSAELRVPLGECNTRRDRTITRVDRAYNIQCAYQEPERMLSTQIDVSPPPIIQISNQMQTPQCEYRIHGQANSDQVRNVQVGDTVEHEWACHGGTPAQAADQAEREAQEQRMAGLFGVLIHDCYVDDGKSRRAQVLDSRGCSLDPQILPTPIYSANTLRATVLSNVAKFPDGDLIGFQCSITVCMRELGRCDGITPPNCSSSPDLSAALNSDGPNGGAGNRTREKRSAEEGGGESISADWELHTPLLTVFDLTDQAEGNDGAQEAFRPRRQSITPNSLQFPPLHRRADHSSSTASFCVSVPMFAALVSLGTFLSTVSTGALLGVLLLRDGISTLFMPKL